MKSIMVKAIGLTLSAAALLAGGEASAALLEIGSGTNFTTQANNDVLGAGVPMVDKATLVTTASNVRLDFYFLGAEAGYKNTLNLAGGFKHDENDTIPGWPGTFLTSITVASAGAVPMTFTSSGWPSDTLSLGSGLTNPTRSIALSYLNCTTGKDAAGKTCAQTTTPTNYVLFALDDNASDDNHDDYVGYMIASQDSQQVVPLPAAAWLLGSGLLGLFGIARRKRIAA